MEQPVILKVDSTGSQPKSFTENENDGANTYLEEKNDGAETFFMRKN